MTIIETVRVAVADVEPVATFADVSAADETVEADNTEPIDVALDLEP